MRRWRWTLCRRRKPQRRTQGKVCACVGENNVPCLSLPVLRKPHADAHASTHIPTHPQPKTNRQSHTDEGGLSFSGDSQAAVAKIHTHTLTFVCPCLSVQAHIRTHTRTHTHSRGRCCGKEAKGAVCAHHVAAQRRREGGHDPGRLQESVRRRAVLEDGVCVCVALPVCVHVGPCVEVRVCVYGVIWCS